jgi:Protein of unknown function (DUF3574)
MPHRQQRRMSAFSILSLLLLTGCAAPQNAPSCARTIGAPIRVFELYFGRSMEGGGEVTDAEWENFRDQVISPNLPGGYTLLDGNGTWSDPKTQSTVTEKTKIMIAATSDTAASTAAIRRVRSAYEQEFKQQSVVITSYLACGSFD